MAIQPYLAMTAAELRNFSHLSFPIAWMACHFSPYGLGLSNLPTALPPGSLLMVDDITPPHGHDPVLIAQQLKICVEDLQCSSILLDFQRCGYDETQSIAEYLTAALPCPTAVSEPYAGNLDCPIFLPPVPPSVPPEEHLAPWKGREVWLELGLNGEILTLTEKGCDVVSFPCPDVEADGFSGDGLHCHYAIETTETSARFTLWRTMNDLAELLAEAEELGVAGTVGLYQELHRFAVPQSLPIDEKVARHSRDEGIVR